MTAREWWAVFDRCAATDPTPLKDEQLIAAEQLRKEGASPYQAAAEVGVDDGSP
jgi:hypothetical protein